MPSKRDIAISDLFSKELFRPLDEPDDSPGVHIRVVLELTLDQAANLSNVASTTNVGDFLGYPPGALFVARVIWTDLLDRPGMVRLAIEIRERDPSIPFSFESWGPLERVEPLEGLPT